MYCGVRPRGSILCVRSNGLSRADQDIITLPSNYYADLHGFPLVRTAGTRRLLECFSIHFLAQSYTSWSRNENATRGKIDHTCHDVGIDKKQGFHTTKQLNQQVAKFS